MPNISTCVYFLEAMGLSESEKQDSVSKFEALGVCNQLAQAAADLNWKFPTPIQAQTIPVLLEGKDIIGLAQTGSGKTGAFALPILQALLSKPQPFFALILSPTRELAIQIGGQFEALGSCIGVRCTALVGGIDLVQQAFALAKRPHVMVGTPGRVVDHLSNTKGFSLRNLKHLVLDEADRLLNMDFEKEIDHILKAIPKERTTQLFSATMTSKVAKLQRACLINPVKVEVASKYQTVETLRQEYIFVPAKYKDCYLILYLTEMAGSTSMIFTRTCDNTRKLSMMLRNLGFEALPIHGNMTQSKRLGALTKFKAGERNILVATDVASRGLDIPSVDLVVNYDVPINSKDYVHRVGRTARAGRSGRSLTIVTQYDVECFQKIETLIGKKLDKYDTDQDAAMLLLQGVTEAQRLATLQMNDLDKNNSKKRKGSSKSDFKRRKY